MHQPDVCEWIHHSFKIYCSSGLIDQDAGFHADLEVQKWPARSGQMEKEGNDKWVIGVMK